jgi:transcriptional regulator with XRE-family HTH domain
MARKDLSAVTGLAARLRARREELGITQRQAAGEIGVSTRLYEAWESGRIRVPQRRKRVLIERWLG